MLTSHYLRIYFSIIIPFKPTSSKWFLSSIFPYKAMYAPLLSPTRATCPTQLILLSFIIRIFVVEYRIGNSSSLQLPRPPYAQIPFSALYFRTPSVREAKFYTYTKLQKNYILDVCISRYKIGRRKIRHRIVAGMQWFQSVVNFFINAIMTFRGCLVLASQEHNFESISDTYLEAGPI